MSLMNWLLFFMILSVSDSRAIRKRRGIWPDVLAPGGNTFASRGYYGMQSYIAYPESGIAMYPTNQGWNPYWQGFPQQNQFNINYNPYGNNQQYPFVYDQGMQYGSYDVNNNQYFPDMSANFFYPSARNNMRTGMFPNMVNPRTAGNAAGSNTPEISNKVGSTSNAQSNGNN